MIFDKFLAILAILISGVRPYDSTDENAYKFHNSMITDLNSPWITGPSEKRYQFHTGQQSWLSARESCLAQNADLVTIRNEEELNWILDHYKPQFPHTRERQIQIGLLIDHSKAVQVKEWRWVDQRQIDNKLLKWVPGEPFDNAYGRERCALLNVNERLMQDIDCDLNGSPIRLFRFICERSSDNHVKHEMLNNPLLKKLTDILDFFGVGSPTSAPPGDNNDYFDSIANETTKSTTPTHRAENSDNATITPNAVTGQQTEDNITKFTQTAGNAESEDLGKNVTIVAIIENDNNNGNKTDANASDDDVTTTVGTTTATEENTSTVEKDFSWEDESESSKSSSTDTVSSESTDETDLETTTIIDEKTATDQMNVSQAIENNYLLTSTLPQVQGSIRKSKRAKALSSGKIALSNSISRRRLAEIARDERGFNPLNHRLIEPEGVNSIPAPFIIDDAASHDDPSAAAEVVVTASAATTRTTKADPLEKLAETLEHSVSHSSDENVKNNAKNASSHEKKIDGTPITKRIHTLERIISAVQTMIEHPEMIATASDFVKVNENDDSKKIVKNVAADARNTKRVDNDNLGLKITADDDDNNDIAFNIEEDFVKAHKEALAHPKINGGDFVIRSDTDVIGACGGSPTENNNVNSKKLDKHSNVKEFVQALQKYLASDQNSELKKILEEKNSENKTLLEKLEEVAKHSGINNITQTSMPKSDSDPDNPVQALIRLYEQKFNKEKKAKIDEQIFAELKRLGEVEAEELDLSAESLRSDNSKSLAELRKNDNDNNNESRSDKSQKQGLLKNNEPNDDKNIRSSGYLKKPRQNKFASNLTITDSGENSVENLPHNPTKEIIDVMMHNPTEDLIEAVLTVQDHFRALLSNNVTMVNATSETDDGTSISPHPQLELLKKLEPKSLSEKHNRAVDEEKKKIDSAYETFNKKAAPVKDLVRRLSAAELKRVKQEEPLPAPKEK